MVASLILGSWLTLCVLAWQQGIHGAARLAVIPTGGSDEQSAAASASDQVAVSSLAAGALRDGPRASQQTPSAQRAAASAAAELKPESDASEPELNAAEEALQLSAFIWGNGVYGAGVVISAHHVLTCLHVVEEMKKVTLSIAEGPAVEAKLVAHDKGLDLAVLFVEQPQPRHARLRSALRTRRGDSVFGMGAPHKMTFSLTRGIVSYVGRRYGGLHYLQTDVPTNSGSSGGPVLDEQGRVLGIASFILRDSQGLAFALPIDYAYQRFHPFFAEAFDTAAFEAWLAEHAEPDRLPL